MNFVVKKEFEIVRQEGDDASVELTVPADIPLEIQVLIVLEILHLSLSYYSVIN